jgi:hypothetical protein
MRRDGKRILLMPGMTLAAVAIYASAALMDWLVAKVAGVPREMVFQNTGLGFSVLCCAAGAYGVARVLTYHPGYQRRHWEWMETVPWRAGVPLPLGPVTLDWRDALVVVPAALLGEYVSGGSVLGPLLAFGVAHLLCLAFTEGRAGWWGYALLAGFGGLLRLSDNPSAVAVAIVPLYGVALGGMRYGLPKVVKSLPEVRTALGAPFEQLAPVAPPKPVPAYVALATSAMVGWWTYCLTWRSWSGKATRLDLYAVGAVVAFGAALIRFAAYRAGSGPPLSLFGRLRTGRWVIPDYDTVYLMPLVTFAASVASAAGLVFVGASPAVVAGVTVGLTTFTALILPPTRARWLLTSPRQIEVRAASGGGAKHVKVGS